MSLSTFFKNKKLNEQVNKEKNPITSTGTSILQNNMSTNKTTPQLQHIGVPITQLCQGVSELSLPREIKKNHDYISN